MKTGSEEETSIPFSILSPRLPAPQRPGKRVGSDQPGARAMCTRSATVKRNRRDAAVMCVGGVWRSGTAAARRGARTESDGKRSGATQRARAKADRRGDGACGDCEQQRAC